MNLINQAVISFNSVLQHGSPDVESAIQAACNAGFNASANDPVPSQFDSFPLLKEWYAVGCVARFKVDHDVVPDTFGKSQTCLSRP